MAFDWLESKRTDALTKRCRERATEARKREVRDRAALLMRLGRTKKEAVRRCRQNFDWEWEMHAPCPGMSEVEGLVDEVYRRSLTLDPGA